MIDHPRPLTNGSDSASVENFATEILSHYQTESPRYLAKMRETMGYVSRIVPSGMIGDLTHTIIKTWVSQMMDDGLAPATIDDRLAYLNIVLRYGLRHGYVQTNPIGTIRQWVPGTYRERYASRGFTPRQQRINPDAVGRVLKYLLKGSTSWEGHRLFTLVATVVYTGLRRDQVLNLNVDDFDLPAATLRIGNPQSFSITIKRESVKLPAKLVEIIGQWLPWTGSPFCFPGDLRKGPWTGGSHGKNALSQIRRAGEAVGIEGLSFELLRACWEIMGGKVVFPTFEAMETPERNHGGFPTLRAKGPYTVKDPVIRLRGPRRRPLIRGTPLDRLLTKAEYRILEAMVKHGCLKGRRIYENELDDVSRCVEAVRYFRRWRKTTPFLSSIIDRPGIKGGRVGPDGKRKSGYSFTPF